jgi:hypothetical protein
MLWGLSWLVSALRHEEAEAVSRVFTRRTAFCSPPHVREVLSGVPLKECVNKVREAIKGSPVAFCQVLRNDQEMESALSEGSMMFLLMTVPLLNHGVKPFLKYLR